MYAALSWPMYMYFVYMLVDVEDIYQSEVMSGGIMIIGPNRLVVRTTRCGRVDPGSNPGSDIIII